MRKNVSLWIVALTLLCGLGQAQQKFSLDPKLYHVFDRDSLRGFDEQAASAAAIAEGFTGREFPVRMYTLKRMYIDSKYNLRPVRHVANPAYAERQVVAGCVNEDFEATQAGTITVSNQVQGWTVTQGENQYPNNSCNLGGCCPSQPTASAVFSVPNGLIDPNIGSCYPIYSVFGSGPINTQASTTNSHIPFGLRGTNFIRINNDENDYSMEKLSKTFSVTPNNALFQFAFISVFYPGHGCCDAGAFNIRLLNASGGNTVIRCWA